MDPLNGTMPAIRLAALACRFCGMCRIVAGRGERCQSREGAEVDNLLPYLIYWCEREPQFARSPQRNTWESFHVKIRYAAA